VREAPDQPIGSRVKRVVLVAAMGIVTLNIWTGAPLLGLWAGSRVAPDSGISMLSVFVVVAVIGAAAWILLQMLGRLQAAHARASGREPTRRQTTWLRPMSGARTRGKGAVAPPLTSVDYVVVGVVVLAVATFEVWFFFFAGSSLPGG
jgi:hypothetical protein